jgi:polygalacturonase
MNRKISILLAALLQFSLSGAQQAFNILDFGAVADGRTTNTLAIQKAIDACHESGGGEVLVPNGVFLTGTVCLKDNVALYLDPSAELLGSSDYDDYQWFPYTKGKNAKRRALIQAHRQKNIAILGRGTINGNGVHPNFHGGNAYNGVTGGLRPFSIYLDSCSRVILKDFKMLNGAFWNMELDACHNVLVDGIAIDSRVIANNDGIDVVDCSNVRIANCEIFTGDDGICLKSNRKVGVKNVTVTNCTVSSLSSAIKLGVASAGGFEDIAITNCALYDTRLSGINLKMVEGGTMNRITVSNITMHNVNGSIFMKLARTKGHPPAIFKNVILSGIIADGIGCWKAGKSSGDYHKEEYDGRIGITITGQEDAIMENVTLSNIHLQFAGGGTEADARRPLKDTKPHGYPKYNNFGITPAYGINCQYVKDIRFNNIVLDYLEDDVRPAMFFQESKNVTLNGIYARVSSRAKACIRFRNQQGAFIINSKPLSGKVPFCSFEETAEDITLMNNDFTHVRGAYVKTGGIDAKSIKMLNNLE